MQLAVPLKVDITTGDQITPREIVFEYKLMFEPRNSDQSEIVSS